jgi:diguanylate cyclase (GGDEF)-like protein
MQAILTHADLLTSLSNRRALDAELERASKSASRTPLGTLLFVDLDHFARVNTEYGHQGGDVILRQAAGILKTLVRGRDMLARYGGDTFALFLSQTTLHDALPIAERVRTLLEDHQFSHGTRPLKVTASVGVAQLTADEMRGAVVSRVEEALDAAQQAGGNACYRHDGQACHPVCSSLYKNQQKPTEESLSLASIWRDSTTTGNDAPGSAPASDDARGLSGRSLFASNLNRRLAEWKRGGPALSVAVLRVDQMQELVTRFGDQGQEFLRQVVGRLLEATTREMDERCEFEDGLFALLLPGIDEASGMAIAERLRFQIRQCKIRMGNDLWDLTASIGLAQCTVADRVMDIMLSAEAAMNEAARLGGDAVCLGQAVQDPQAAGI